MGFFDDGSDASRARDATRAGFRLARHDGTPPSRISRLTWERLTMSADLSQALRRGADELEGK